MRTAVVTTLRAYKTIILAALVALAVVIGVVVALRIKLTPESSQGSDALLSDIVLGTPFDPTQEVRLNPILRQKSSYATTDKIALRVTTAAAVTQPLVIRARLLDVKNPQGSIVELTPAQITLQPGTTTFCCWTITRAGTYNLQLFRPEGTVTSLPLTIRQDFNATPLPRR